MNGEITKREREREQHQSPRVDLNMDFGLPEFPSINSNSFLPKEIPADSRRSTPGSTHRPWRSPTMWRPRRNGWRSRPHPWTCARLGPNRFTNRTGLPLWRWLVVWRLGWC